MKNIVLIGMPGVGKSTLGVILAKVIGYRFIDTDLIIQEKSGKLLKEIITERGVQGFIDYENEICSSVQADKCVIATGGSAVYGKNAMEHLRSIGTVIYLRVDYETVAKRVSDISGRGVVARNGQTLLDIYSERSPLYEKHAHVICDMNGKSIEDNLKTVLKAIEKSESV